MYVRTSCIPPKSLIVRPITTTTTHTLYIHIYLILPPPNLIKITQTRLLDAAGTVEEAETQRRTAREEATALKAALRAAEAEKRELEGRLQGAVRCYWRQRAVLGRAMEVGGWGVCVVRDWLGRSTGRPSIRLTYTGTQSTIHPTGRRNACALRGAARRRGRRGGGQAGGARGQGGAGGGVDPAGTGGGMHGGESVGGGLGGGGG